MPRRPFAGGTLTAGLRRLGAGCLAIEPGRSVDEVGPLTQGFLAQVEDAATAQSLRPVLLKEAIVFGTAVDGQAESHFLAGSDGLPAGSSAATATRGTLPGIGRLVASVSRNGKYTSLTTPSTAFAANGAISRPSWISVRNRASRVLHSRRASSSLPA